MPKVTVTHKPVVAPIEKVTIELTLEEAQVLKLICNYRQRVADAIIAGEKAQGRFATFLDTQEVVSLLFGIFRVLHDQDVHASNR